MKSISLLFAIAAFAATADVQAERGASPDLGGCTSELEARYGRDVQFDIVNKRRQRHGTRVRMAVHLDADNRQFATCWVSADDIATLEVDAGETLVAATHQGDADK